MSPELAHNLIGIILMTVLGLSIGNYATSIVYRLPRGLKIANDPPYCECERRMYLTVRDNFPFFSWLMSRGKCRWCDIRIPGNYAMVELACAILFVSAFFRFGVGDELILIIGLGVFSITQAALYYAEQKLFTRVVIMVVMFGALYRTLLDGSIFPFIIGGYLGLMLGVVFWLVKMALARSKKPLPPIAIMLAVGGLCVTAKGLPLLIIVSAGFSVLFFLLGQMHKPLATAAPIWAVSLATLVALYYPSLLG